MSSILRSSKFVRYFFGLARSIVISNRQEIDGSLLQRSHNLVGLTNKFSSSPFILQSNSLEKTVRQLDEDARRTGRVSVSEVEEALNSIKFAKIASASQSLLVIRCCGNLVPEETPEKRTKLVEEIWKTFKNLGVPLDISHYNALLKVYLENEHKFSPTEFLAKLEADGIEPNRVTYQRLIAGFCQQGDIAGATKILEFMKEKELPVSEGVFNALILGHSKAGDMESAVAVLNVMRGANLEPSNETYATLLSGYATRGDTAAVARVLQDCKLRDVLLSDRDLLDVGFVAAINGHEQLLDEMLKHVRHSVGYNQDAVNVTIRLITAGKDEAAYKVFLSLTPPAGRYETTPNVSGHIFIKHLVRSNRPVDQILAWCERLKQDGHTPRGLHIAVDASFQHTNTHLAVDLLRALREKGEPVRMHYFWPSLVNAGKTSGVNRMLEILKLMIDEFEVTVNTETLKDYFFPYALSKTSVAETLNSLFGVGVKRGHAVVAAVSYLITKDRLKEAAELSHQFPGFNYRFNLATRQLVSALPSGDVSSVVALLHVLVSPRPSEAKEDLEEEEDSGSEDELVTRFLLNVVSFAPAKKYIAELLKEMLDRGIPITNHCAEAIQSKLQGMELTSEISELLAKLSSGDIVPQPIKRTNFSSPPPTRTPESLLRIRERMKANNETEEKLCSITRSLFSLYCIEGDVENALKIKQELEEEYKQEATLGMWAALLDAYCVKNDFEGAKNCMEKIKAMESEPEIDGAKTLKLAKLYVENNQIDEAENLLKSIKPRKKEDSGYLSRFNSWNLLQAAGDTYKDPERVRNLLNLLVQHNYVEVSNPMLGAIMKAHLIRDDLEGALKEFRECVRQYRATPYKNELTIKFIEKEDATSLQTVVDLSTEVHGEVNSLYDLVLAFIECGKIRQARKILETPGLTGRSGRLSAACERYKKEGKADYLEGLVDATKDVPFIDRSEIYNSLLDTYCQADEVDKALGLWTKMQDEDVNVTDEFLTKLGKFLLEKGHPVPFQIPEKVLMDTEPTPKAAPEKTTPKPSTPPSFAARSPLITAISNKNVDEALKIKDELVNSGKRMMKQEVSRLLELLVEQGKLQEATALVTSLKDNQMPLVRTLNYLITRLAAQGHLDLMNQLSSALNAELQKLTSFSNRRFAAAANAGRAREELDKLEKEIEAAKGEEDVDRAVAAFPRGGIMSVLDNCPADYDQVARIVDKFHARGASGPANCLVMHHLTRGEVTRARELFDHYNLNNSSQLMFRSVLTKARQTQEPRLLDDLLAVVSDAPAFTPQARGLVYSDIIGIYADKGDYDTGLQRLEEAVKIVPLEMFKSNTLVKLKSGLEANNKTFNFTIPPQRKQKESSSSSSSSSETEPKKSVASN